MKNGVQETILEPTVEQITAALRCTDAPDTPDGLGCANKQCRYRDVDGACDIVSMCFDAAAKITKLNDFQNSQCAKLLARITELESRLLESQRRERAAVEDIKHSDNCDVCVGSGSEPDSCGCECMTCTLDCRCRDCWDESKFEWRGPHEAGEGTEE